ncbi:MAG: hypothetical protein ACREUK_05280 [Burkholderiales bacterium]
MRLDPGRLLLPFVSLAVAVSALFALRLQQLGAPGGEKLVPFALNERRQLRMATDGYRIEPKAGWTVVAFVPPEETVQ